MVTLHDPTLQQAQHALLEATLADEKASEALRLACDSGRRGWSSGKEQNARMRAYATH